MHSVQFSGNHKIVISDSSVFMDGMTYPLPNDKEYHSSTIINNDVFIDGYELKKGKWKRTIRAMWHLLF